MEEENLVPETITISKTDYEAEKKKIYQGGLAEGKKVLTKAQSDYLAKIKAVIPDAPESFEEAYDHLILQLGKKETNASEEIKQFQAKVSGLSSELEKEKSKTKEERDGKNSYIINAELMQALENRAYDSSDAVQLFRNTYRVDLLANGDIHVYDKSGNIINNEKYEPASLKEVMDIFLSKKPHLVRTESRQGSGGSEKTGVRQSSSVELDAIMRKDASQRTPADKEKLLRAFEKGEITL